MAAIQSHKTYPMFILFRKMRKRKQIPYVYQTVNIALVLFKYVEHNGALYFYNKLCGRTQRMSEVRW